MSIYRCRNPHFVTAVADITNFIVIPLEQQLVDLMKNVTAFAKCEAE